MAVKVQRPDLHRIIGKDFAALSYLVALGEGLFPRLRAFDLPVIVREFANSLERETDFRHEAHSMVLIRAALADVPDFWIPDVIAEASTGKVLTMEYSAGERVDLYGKNHPEAMPKAINTLVKLMLHSIFEEGLFHADSHPGNVFVLPDGRLSLLDFGMTGELDEAMRESLTRLLEAVVNGDARATTEAYLEMAPANEQVNRAALVVDVKAVLYEIHRHSLADASIGNAFEALLRAGSENGVHNPGEFFLLTRAFIILESMIRQLSPGHDYMKSFQEEIARRKAQHFSLGRIQDKTTRLAREMERLFSDAPSDTRRILRRFAEGNLGRVQSPGMEALGDRVSNNLERLASSVAFGSLVVGGSLLLFAQMGGWHHRLGEAMVISGILGMVIRSLGAWLRNRRRP
ncbi:hypothetical protein METEAL_23420 [Mesoterricola silvestris]|uniref:ABC1 atypical kinase-like domain-containing protein n=1 Tax=Mesoterricola silvestris TaxID=2927979 RepID=A0AA48GZE0_9BACT|nr:hypothetical protein METEAL_23420 [Mesoterricola silvestris]